MNKRPGAPRGQSVAGLLAALAVASVAPSARAQNTEGFYYSEDAALMAGAVTARPGEAAALWYNPAGLASIERGRLTASGSVFGLRVRAFEHALDTVLGGERYSLDLDSADVVAVPNALTGAFHLGGPVTLGVGLFVTVRDVRKGADTIVDAPIPAIPGATLSERADLQTDATKYHLGPGVGIALSPRVRVGIAAFATYATTALSAQFAFAVAGEGIDTHELQQATLEATAIGLTGSLGMQADVTDRITLGLTLRPPEVSVFGSSSGGTVNALASSVPTPLSRVEIISATDEDAAGTLAAPARLTAGVLVRFARVEAELDVDVRSGLRNEALLVDVAPQVDLRAGVRIEATDSVAVGFGAFSDRSAIADLAPGFSNERVDYYGGTGGVTLRTPFALVSSPDEEGLVLTTTLALRYAVGVGEIRALVLGDVTDSPRRDVTYHDLMPFFGSSIAY